MIVDWRSCFCEAHTIQISSDDARFVKQPRSEFSCGQMGTAVPFVSVASVLTTPQETSSHICPGNPKNRTESLRVVSEADVIRSGWNILWNISVSDVPGQSRGKSSAALIATVQKFQVHRRASSSGGTWL